MSATAYVRLFDVEPDLLARVPEEHRARLRANLTVPACELPRGRWFPPGGPAPFAMIVLDGVVLRAVEAFRHRTVELLAQGDVVLAGEHFAIGPERCSLRWFTPSGARIAVLDAEVERRLHGVPGILPQLLGRHQRRLDALTLQANIARKRGIPARVLIYLWHLADRIGQRTGREVVIRAHLGHALLADLVSAERASVSRALRVLTDFGYLRRAPDRLWVLCGSVPPEFDRVELELEASRYDDRSPVQ